MTDANHGSASDETVAPHVEEHESGRAVARIARALPPFERAYAFARFVIMRQKLLALMNLVLPAEGRILDVGCGFGLFSAYFGLMCPARRMVGVDPSARRIEMARTVARKLDLRANEYHVGTAETLAVEGSFDAIFMLDVLHHVPPESQLSLLEHLRDRLAPDGVMLIKDVTTDQPFKLGFTRLLDRAMVGLNEPLAYRHHHEWSRMLARLGMRTRIVRVPDVLPYPHVVIVGRPER